MDNLYLSGRSISDIHVVNDTDLVNEFINIAFSVDGSRLQDDQARFLFIRNSREYYELRPEPEFDI
jgi:hypothetical protein